MRGGDEERVLSEWDCADSWVTERREREDRKGSKRYTFFIFMS